MTSPARSPALPSVPTMLEAGVPPADVELRFWFAIFGPKGMPDAGEGQDRPGGRQSRWTIRRCVSGSPSSTSRRTSFRARRCTRKLENEIKNWTRLHRRQGHQGGITGGNGEVPHAAAPHRPIDAMPRAWSNGRSRSDCTRRSRHAACHSVVHDRRRAASALRHSRRRKAAIRTGRSSSSSPSRRAAHRHVLPADLERAGKPRSASRS